MTVISDTAIACVGFFLIKQVAGAEILVQLFGYIVGAAGGSMVGMHVTKHRKEA